MTSKQIFQHTREPDLQDAILPYKRTWRPNRYSNIHVHLICKLQYHLTSEHDVQTDIPTYTWIWFPFRNTTVTHESDVHANIPTSMWTCSVRRYTRNRHLNRYMWIWCAASSLRHSNFNWVWLSWKETLLYWLPKTFQIIWFPICWLWACKKMVLRFIAHWNTTISAKERCNQVFQNTSHPALQAIIPSNMRTWRRPRYSNIPVNLIYTQK